MTEKSNPLPPYILVENSAQWRDCLAVLQQQPRLAIDLEANSMFAYREQICLMQISVPDQDYIIDPLADIDFAPLGEMVMDPNVEKIFHAAEYDLILMKRQFDWDLVNLFDTMWAARILGYQRYGLASLIGDLFGVKLDKRFQKSNWCQRPLKQAQFAYAQHDTHFLFRLRDLLAKELEEAGRSAEAQAIFTEQTHVKLPDDTFDPESFWSIRGARDLPKDRMATLRELAIYRNKVAERRNLPHFKIMSDRTLVELANRRPRNMHDVSQVYGMSSGQVRRYGRDVIDIIAKTRNAPIPRYPRRPRRHSEEVVERYDRLHTWRKHRAQKRGVESDVIISREGLWEIAKANPDSAEALAALPHVRPWRLDLYGDDIMDILAENGANGNSAEGSRKHR